MNVLGLISQLIGIETLRLTQCLQDVLALEFKSELNWGRRCHNTQC